MSSRRSVCIYELNITSERGADPRGARSLAAKLTSYGMCASLMNNGSAPVNDCLPDPQQQLHQQEDCGPRFDSRMRTTSITFPSLPPHLQLLILAAQKAADPLNDVNTCPPCRAGGQKPTGGHPNPRFSNILSSVSGMTTFAECKIPCVIPTESQRIQGLQFCFNKLSLPLSLCM